jgi:hypothetical protein
MMMVMMMVICTEPPDGIHHGGFVLLFASRSLQAAAYCYQRICSDWQPAIFGLSEPGYAVWGVLQPWV